MELTLAFCSPFLSLRFSFLREGRVLPRLNSNMTFFCLSLLCPAHLILILKCAGKADQVALYKVLWEARGACSLVRALEALLGGTGGLEPDWAPVCELKATRCLFPAPLHRRQSFLALLVFSSIFLNNKCTYNLYELTCVSIHHVH